MHDQQIVGRYYLVAIDMTENMQVCFRPDDAYCVGEGLPGPAVFAAGGNAHFVVIARHPNQGVIGAVDRNVTEYYYIVRSRDERRAHRRVVGPLGQAVFQAESRRLDLPAFAITIDRL